MKNIPLRFFAVVLVIFACAGSYAAAQSLPEEKNQPDTAGAGSDRPSAGADKEQDVPASELLPVTDSDAGKVQPRGGDYTPNFLKFLLYTALVIGIIFLVFYGIKKFIPGSKRFFASDAVQIIARRQADAGSAIQLVLVGSKIFVIAVSKTGITPLGEITDPREVALIKIQCGAAKPDSAQADFQRELSEAASDLESYGKDAARGEAYKKIQNEIDEIKNTMKKWNNT